MSNQDILYTVIESGVKNGLRYIKDHPKRGIRNLVDLGEYFATGKKQKDFFDLIHNILKNDNSSYYEILENMVKNINHERLTHFGINLGYNSFIHGAKLIRENEENNDFNIPWILVFDFKKLCNKRIEVDNIQDLIKQGKDLGIFSYIFLIDEVSDLLNDLFKIISLNQDCAFILFLDPKIINEEIIIEFQKTTNTFIFLQYNEKNQINDEKLINSLKLLRKHKFLYGIYKYYNDSNYNDIIEGNFTKELLKTKSNFAILLKKENCNEENAKSTYEYILNSRIKSNSPVFLLDFYEDINQVNKNISGDSCFVSVDLKGQVTILSLFNKKSEYDIYKDKLIYILSNTMIKKN